METFVLLTTGLLKLSIALFCVSINDYSIDLSSRIYN